ncbi:hypothetical protein [Candidatus Palauibacter sp.]|uniref:hypothetical protein n=1 Tax=Candidatus Palauibacter sp. TaxID=3101350 RepID=UPI003B010C53
MSRLRLPGLRLPGLLLPLVVLAVSSHLQAQSVGDRVRVSVEDDTYVGEVTAVSEEGLELVDDSVPYSFEYALMTGLDRSVGTKRMWKEGFVAGVTVPVLIAVEATSLCFEGLGVMGDAVGIIFCALVAMPIFVVSLAVAAVGGVVGAGIGAFIKGDVWEPVVLAERAFGSASIIGPRFGLDGSIGLELGVSIRFP